MMNGLTSSPAWVALGWTIRADAETLALLPRAPGEERDVPVLVAGRSGKAKTFYAGLDDTWRWRAVDHLYFHRFWAQVIRSVAREAE
jgi:hypothetical protein